MFSCYYMYGSHIQNAVTGLTTALRCWLKTAIDHFAL